MLTFYIDDSEHQGQLGIMAGYIAHDGMWDEFNREWQATLNAAHVPEFHATDFYSGQGHFKGWKVNSGKHKKFRRRFTAIAEGLVSLGVAQGVELEAFSKLVASSQIILRGTPHGKLTYRMWCARECLKWVSKHPHGRPLDEPIAVILESGKGMGEAAEYLNWLKRQRVPWMDCFVSFTTAGKSLLPLQAADLIANETKRELVEFQKLGARKPIRTSMKRLLKGGLIKMMIATELNMQRFVPLLEHGLSINDPEVVADFEGTVRLWKEKKRKQEEADEDEPEVARALKWLSRAFRGFFAKFRSFR